MQKKVIRSLSDRFLGRLNEYFYDEMLESSYSQKIHLLELDCTQFRQISIFLKEENENAR